MHKEVYRERCNKFNITDDVQQRDRLEELEREHKEIERATEVGGQSVIRCNTLSICCCNDFQLNVLMTHWESLSARQIMQNRKSSKGIFYLAVCLFLLIFLSISLLLFLSISLLLFLFPRLFRNPCPGPYTFPVTVRPSLSFFFLLSFLLDNPLSMSPRKDLVSYVPQFICSSVYFFHFFSSIFQRPCLSISVLPSLFPCAFLFSLTHSLSYYLSLPFFVCASLFHLSLRCI